MAKRTLYFHIHGTTGLLGDYGTTLFKGIAGKFCSDLFTTGKDEKLIPIKDAPAAAHHFKEIYDSFTQEGDQFYFQWSGNLSESARKQAASYLAGKITEMTDDDDDIEVIILGHSHGGNIAKHTAEMLSHDDRIKFHMITNAMPLCSTPPQMMPKDNVKTWQHFYNNSDINAKIGSILMQSGNMTVLRQIEQLAAEIQKSDPAFTLPNGWQSHLLDCGSSDIHNNAMRAKAAKTICDIIKEKLVEAGLYAETTSGERKDVFFDTPEADTQTLSSGIKK